MSGLIHLQHFRDKEPLCWNMVEPIPPETVSTLDESQVTCPECIDYMMEEDRL